MAEESKTTTETTPEVTAPVTPPEAVKTGNDAKFTEADVEKIVKERLEREKAKRAQAEKDAADKAAAETAAKNGEWEKVAKAKDEELAKIKTQLAERELNDRKRAIAEKVGLPAALASRLVGSTDEELEKDAKSILDTIPKPKTTASPTNPGANGQQGETDAQRKARIFGTDFDPFDPETAKRKGGGFFITGE